MHCPHCGNHDTEYMTSGVGGTISCMHCNCTWSWRTGAVTQAGDAVSAPLYCPLCDSFVVHEDKQQLRCWGCRHTWDRVECLGKWLPKCDRIGRNIGECTVSALCKFNSKAEERKVEV